MTTLVAQIQPIVEHTMATYGVPGIVVAVAHKSDPIQCLAFGTDATGHLLREDSLVPVASITKLATALVVLRLSDAGKLSLDDSLEAYVPEAAARGRNVTIRSLLTHTSGLPLRHDDTLAPWNERLTWSAIAEACIRTELQLPPGTRVSYSNVGYCLLGVIVERVTGLSFAVALKMLMLEPLGIEAYLGDEPPRRPAHIADAGPFTDTSLEQYNTRFWRSLALPASGILITAAGAIQLAQTFVGKRAQFLLPETVRNALRNQVGSLGGGSIEGLSWPHCPWGLGPELRGAKSPHWTPDVAAPSSFGHLGASGCVVWVDPIAELSWAILGTRTTTNLWNRHGLPAIGTAIFSATRSASSSQQRH